MIGWKVNRLDMSRASFRYRALFPAFNLEKMGYDAVVFSDVNKYVLDSLTMIIFVKSFTPKDYEYALKARKKRIPIILDLCDNIFIENYNTKHNYTRLFIQFASIANQIIVSTVELKKVLLDLCPENITITVIKDGIEDLNELKKVQHFYMQSKTVQLIRRKNSEKKAYLPILIKPEVLIKDFKKQGRKNISLKVRQNLPFLFSKIQQRLFKKKDTPKKLLWFGIHGGAHADFGMLDLLHIQSSLERVAESIDVELIIVSNHFLKYKKSFPQIKINTRYFEWTPSLIYQLLTIADIVILPSQFNDFVSCKSENRAVLSLNAGIPVVATYKPVYKNFKMCMLFDDFYIGVMKYLSMPKLVKKHINIAQDILKKDYSKKALSTQYLLVFNQIMKTPIKNTLETWNNID